MENHAKCMSISINDYPRQKKLKLNDFPFKDLFKIVIYTEMLFGVTRHFFRANRKGQGLLKGSQ